MTSLASFITSKVMTTIIEIMGSIKIGVGSWWTYTPVDPGAIRTSLVKQSLFDNITGTMECFCLVLMFLRWVSHEPDWEQFPKAPRTGLTAGIAHIGVVIDIMFVARTGVVARIGVVALVSPFISLRVCCRLNLPRGLQQPS